MTIPNLNLSNPVDFARATMGDLSGLIGLFAGKNPSEWTLLEGSYQVGNKPGDTKEILFHVFKSASEYSASVPQISDKSGRRKVKYKFPYLDGQTSDDLGAQPESFDVEILLHGPNYMVGLQALLAAFNDPRPGILKHPVMGIMPVFAEEWTKIHASDTRKAVLLKVQFNEHTFTVKKLDAVVAQKTTKSALNSALAFFAKIDTVLQNVAAFGRAVQTVKSTIEQAISNFKNGYATLLGSMNVTFNSGSSQDIPGLLPVNLGGNLNKSGGQSSSTFPTVQNPTLFSTVPVNQVTGTGSIAIAVDDLIKQVNASRAECASIITQLKALDGGQGALEFHDDILNLREAAIALQDVLEAGIATSQAQVLNYTVPRLMSIREVAFANGIDVNRVDELDQLNTFLESVNFIPAGTVMRVPSI